MTLQDVSQQEEREVLKQLEPFGAPLRLTRPPARSVQPSVQRGLLLTTGVGIEPRTYGLKVTAEGERLRGVERRSAVRSGRWSDVHLTSKAVESG